MTRRRPIKVPKRPLKDPVLTSLRTSLDVWRKTVQRVGVKRFVAEDEYGRVLQNKKLASELIRMRLGPKGARAITPESLERVKKYWGERLKAQKDPVKE